MTDLRSRWHCSNCDTPAAECKVDPNHTKEINLSNQVSSSMTFPDVSWPSKFKHIGRAIKRTRTCKKCRKSIETIECSADYHSELIGILAKEYAGKREQCKKEFRSVVMLKNEVRSLQKKIEESMSLIRNALNVLEKQ